jgi:hypothetical protein
MDATAGYDVRQRLLADHARLERVFGQVLAAFEANDREQVCATWAEFDTGLLAHMSAEERYLIPSLFRLDARAARAIIEDHRHIRTRLLELGTGVDLHIVRLGTTQAFIEELRAHAKHEDRLLYMWADEHPEESDRRSLLAALFDGATEPAISPGDVGPPTGEPLR